MEYRNQLPKQRQEATKLPAIVMDKFRPRKDDRKEDEQYYTTNKSVTTLSSSSSESPRYHRDSHLDDASWQAEHLNDFSPVYSP